MHSGGATRNVATWRMLINGVNEWHDPWVSRYFSVFLFLGFKTFLTFTLIICSKFIFSVHSYDRSDSAPAISFGFFLIQPFILQGTFLFSSSSIPLSFIIYYEFLIFFFALCFVVVVFDFRVFRILFPFHGQFL